MYLLSRRMAVLNLFTNLYNNVDEIREWLKEDKEAADAYLSDHPSVDLEGSDLENIAVWLTEHEDEAKRYREYHYGRQWGNVR